MKYAATDNTNATVVPCDTNAATSTAASASENATAAGSCAGNDVSTGAANSADGNSNSTPKCGSISSIITTPVFSEQVNTVTKLFEKWSDCERIVGLCVLLKQLNYPSLKMLQFTIEHNLGLRREGPGMCSVVVLEINANNPSYLQNLLNAYKTFNCLHLAAASSADAGGTQATLTADGVQMPQISQLAANSRSTSVDKDLGLPYYGFDFQLTSCDSDRKVYISKEDILRDVLHMLPVLKPGNDEAKYIYLAMVPIAVKDAVRKIVPTVLVQQLFSYLLIHPAITTEERKSLNVFLRQLEEHIRTMGVSISAQYQTKQQQLPNFKFMQSQQPLTQDVNLVGNGMSSGTGLVLDNALITSGSSGVTSVLSTSSSSSSGASSSSVTCASLLNATTTTTVATRNTDWQTIAPPSKLHHHQQQQAPAKTLREWTNAVSKPPALSQVRRCVPGIASVSVGVVNVVVDDQLCDKFNGITLNELASSQNSLGLVLGGTLVDQHAESSSLVNGVVAAATVTAAPSLFGVNANPIINNGNNSCSEDHDTSFSKNGTEIIDFEPNTPHHVDNSNQMNSSHSCMSNSNGTLNVTTTNAGNNLNYNRGEQPTMFHQQLGYASMLMNNYDQLDVNRWSLDSKLTALKTRRSNSLTTQTISSSSSSSNSSVVTVNDNYSNSTENLAAFANKPRSFSLSIENHRSALTGSDSDTRLDDFKPGYIKFQARNVGMSSIGLWLKSLRLHKYIELFKNMTYEEMLHIGEDYLQSLGVTKGASHKLALCIEKLNERCNFLAVMEQELLGGHAKMRVIIEELANIVLTPMKPIEAVNVVAGEENVALQFIRVVDLVCQIVPTDPYLSHDDEALSVIMWILDRSIHNEAFVNQSSQLKEFKFKISKLKMPLGPKLHHTKNGSNGNLNKPSFPPVRWNSKTRKCDTKNGSNDRINQRKNSNDLLNFSLGGCMQQQQQHINSAQLLQQSEYEHKYQLGAPGCSSNNGVVGGNVNSNTQPQYQNATFPFLANPPPPKQQLNHHQIHQQQQVHQMIQQHAHFPALPSQQHLQLQQHRRSLNNLIVVASGPKQPQPMIFKPGQGMFPATSSENLYMDHIFKQQHQHRKASLTPGHTFNNNNSFNISNNKNNNINNNVSLSNNSDKSNTTSMLTTFMTTTTTTTTTSTTTTNTNNMTAAAGDVAHQQQPQQQKKTMAAVVMVSSEDIVGIAAASSGSVTDSGIGVGVGTTGSNLVTPMTSAAATSQPVTSTSPPPSPSLPPQIFILNHSSNNNHSNDTNNSVLCQRQHQLESEHHQQHRQHQQQMQQLQLLAVAAAAVGSSCNHLNHINNSATNNNNNCICNNNKNYNTSAINCCSSNSNNSIISTSNVNRCICCSNETSFNTFDAGAADKYVALNDFRSLEQLETLCLQMTEQAIN